MCIIIDLKKLFKRYSKCPICLEKIKNVEQYKTKCNHLYHNDCINIWLQRNNTCPMCRKELYIKKNTTNIILDLNEEMYNRIISMQLESQIEILELNIDTPIVILEPILDW